MANVNSVLKCKIWFYREKLEWTKTVLYWARPFYRFVQKCQKCQLYVIYENLKWILVEGPWGNHVMNTDEVWPWCSDPSMALTFVFNYYRNLLIFLLLTLTTSSVTSSLQKFWILVNSQNSHPESITSLRQSFSNSHHTILCLSVIDGVHLSVMM